MNWKAEFPNEKTILVTEVKKEPAPESVPEMSKKPEKKSIFKPLSCLGIFVAIFLALYFTIPFMVAWLVNDFFAGLAPKQMDVDRASEAIRRINARMDEFEESFKPLQEQIDKLDNLVPKNETIIDRYDQNDEGVN